MCTPRREGFMRPARAGRRREIDAAAVEGVGPRPRPVASGDTASGETSSTPSSLSSSSGSMMPGGMSEAVARTPSTAASSETTSPSSEARR